MHNLMTFINLDAFFRKCNFLEKFISSSFLNKVIIIIVLLLLLSLLLLLLLLLLILLVISYYLCDWKNISGYHVVNILKSVICPNF